MTIEDLQKICITLQGTTIDIKWEDHLCFNVGNKIYLITSPDKVPQSASFKANDDDFTFLCERDGCIPAPYLARYKWVQIEDIKLLSIKEWDYYIRNSYKIVFDKLPSKVRKGIST